MVLQLVLIQIVTFVVIIGVLRLIFGSQLRTAMGRLQDLHQDSLEKEEVLNKELERARAMSQGEIARSREEAKQMIDSARHTAERLTGDIMQQAQVQAKKVIADAGTLAKRMEADLVASAQEKAVGMAEELVNRTFAPAGRKVLHEHFFDEWIEELAGVDKSRLSVKVKSAQVLTSFALSDPQKVKLRDVLAAKLGYPVDL
jgi:F-type H+-transporting ATPase subunit b